MRESPRIRRLRTDLRGLERLREQSTVFDFSVPGSLQGGFPESYQIRFRGRGVWRPAESDQVLLREQHEVSVDLGAGYPRMMPTLNWRTPIFHPNISASGVVCLGGYGTHWVPSLNLDELCGMLWDMVRYQNYDVESPYNREAATWAKTQSQFRLPIDPRPIRDRLAAAARDDAVPREPPIATPRSDTGPEIMFLRDEEIVDAEVIEPEGPDIIYID